MKARIRSSILVLMLLGGGLAGCSDSEPERVKTDLTDIEAEFKPKMLWRAKSADGVGDYASGLKPVVSGDMVFHASRHGEVYAVDTLRGRRMWTQDLALYDSEAWLPMWAESRSARLSGGITAAGGKLYIGSENAEVFALDEYTGSVLWQQQVAGEVLARPTVSGDLVLINTSIGKLQALSVDDGSEVWSFDQNVPLLTVRGMASPAASQGAVVLGQPDGKVAAMTLEEGRIFWEQRLSIPSGSTDLQRLVDIVGKPVIIGLAVYVSSYNQDLVALDLRDGRPVWRREVGTVKEMAHDDRRLYLTDLDDNVHAIDRLTGRELWMQSGLRYRDVTAPVLFGEHIVVGDNDGYLHWLSRDSGEFVARVRLGRSGVYTAPAVTEKVLFVPSRKGQLTAITTPEHIRTE